MEFIEIVSLKQVKKKRQSKKLPEKISSLYQIAIWLSDEIGNSTQENLVALYLDHHNNINAYSLISRGSVSESVANPRDVAQRALMSNASKVLIAHNHPSGTTDPSTSDDNITTKIENALSLFSIMLLDHLIVSDDHNDFYSYRNNGQLRR